MKAIVSFPIVIRELLPQINEFFLSVRMRRTQVPGVRTFTFLKVYWRTVGFVGFIIFVNSCMDLFSLLIFELQHDYPMKINPALDPSLILLNETLQANFKLAAQLLIFVPP